MKPLETTIKTKGKSYSEKLIGLLKERECLSDEDMQLVTRLQRQSRGRSLAAILVDSGIEEDAVQRATSVPIRTMELCNSILITLETMIGKSNKMLVSDLATASIIAKASTEISAWTARINLPLLGDSDLQSELTEKIQALLASSDSIAQNIDKACRAV